MLIRNRRAHLIWRIRRQDPTLATINLSGRWLENDYIREIADALSRKDSTVKKLVLVGCSLTEMAITLLGEALKTNTSLVVLDLRYNQISGAGAVTLCGGLQSNRTLKYLDLSNNQLGLEEIKQLVLALKLNFTLTNLNLKDNGMDNSAMFVFLDCFVYNSSLTTVQIASKGNSVSKHWLDRLGEILKANRCGARTTEVRVKKRGLAVLQDERYATELFYSQVEGAAG